MYESGMTMKKVGEALGVSDTLVYNFMKENNIPTRKARRYNLNKEQVASMYESGMTMEKIAEALDVSENTIQLFIKKHNIKSLKSFRLNKK